MYSDVQRAFLQACGNHGSITKSKALEILKNIMVTFADNRDCNDETLIEITGEINEKLSFVDQKITFINHDISSNDYVVLIGTVTDHINKFRSQFTESDRNYFAVLLKEITQIRNHSLAFISATNLIYELNDKKLSKQHASKLLEIWIQLGYFLNSDDKIFLGPKGIAEFDKYLKSNYPNDVQECKICKSVIFYGLKCGNDNCTDLIHRKCIKEILKKSNNCPNCKGLWETDPKQAINI